MGISASKEPRRCGLCYCGLPASAPFLDEPRLDWRRMPQDAAWTCSVPLDTLVHLPKETFCLRLRTKPKVLRDSIDRGCNGCSAIWQAAKNEVARRGLSLDERCMDGCCEINWLVGDRESHSHSLQLELLVDRGNFTYRTETVALVLWYPGRSSGKGHPAARKLSRAAELGYTGSTASLTNLKQWLAECALSHRDCKRDGLVPRALPDRVLELSQTPSGGFYVRLLQNDGAKVHAPYACLSHRWGPSTVHCRTLKATISQHLYMLPWSKLPKTFQEAIVVTLHLGLKYLWIDSLCIIQDDTDDWNVQAAKMCDIYEGSHITIAATSSTDSDDGLFRTVPSVPIQSYDSSPPKLFIRNAPRHISYSINPISDYDDEFPLVTRGWVCQERLLSPRVIHFSRYELSFMCSNPYSLCECGVRDYFFDKRNHDRSLEESNLSEIRRYWHQIIGQYSGLRLSYQSDRLPALAGVARQYGIAHATTLGRYVAGLWEHTLIYDLIWDIPEGYSLPRPDTYCGPTWSWASVTGRVGTLSAYSRARDDLEVLEFRVEPAGPDEYGSVASAELTVRGYLAEGMLAWVEEPDRPRRIGFSYSKSEAKDIKIDYDTQRPGNPDYAPIGSRVYCLKTGFIGDGCHICLVLRAVDGESKSFQRIGIIEFTQLEVVDTWFMKGRTKETMRLV